MSSCSPPGHHQPKICSSKNCSSYHRIPTAMPVDYCVDSSTAFKQQDESTTSNKMLFLGNDDFPFKGKIFTPGMEGYVRCCEKNYAYNSKYMKEMFPKMFSYPENGDLQSIQSAISFGRKMGMPVMGRSGGHQYSGVSSDNDSLIVDMEEWNDISTVQDSEATVGQDLASRCSKLVTVGAGVRLGDLAKKVAEAKCTLPMGECPSVCVGGHMQSGGWNHFQRALGLLTEYVFGFTIVTAEGVKRVSCNSTGREFDLYNAVRGGSPGAFGIITDATILLLSDEQFPNARAYAELITIQPSSIDDEDGALAQVYGLFMELLNKYGDSAEALGVSMEGSLVTKSLPYFLSKSHVLNVLLVEVTILDDTDETALNLFNYIRSIIEKAKQTTSSCCTNFGYNNILKRILFPGDFKNGNQRSPLSEISKTFVRESKYLMTPASPDNPTRRMNIMPFEALGLWPRANIKDIPVDLFLNGSDEAVTQGAKKGLLNIFRSVVTDLVGAGKPLDQIVCQFVWYAGSQRGEGPFPSIVPWSKNIRGTLGFDRWGTSEGLADPRTWKSVQAFLDLEREYMLSPEESEAPIRVISFSFDTNGDTSKGGCDRSQPSYDLKDKRVQRMYYDPNSNKGFDWISSVKHDWDSEDIFHSRLTVPGKPSTEGAKKKEESLSKRKYVEAEVVWDTMKVE